MITVLFLLIKETTLLIIEELLLIKETTLLIIEELLLIKEEVLLLTEELLLIKETTLLVIEELLLIKENAPLITEEILLPAENNFLLTDINHLTISVVFFLQTLSNKTFVQNVFSNCTVFFLKLIKFYFMKPSKVVISFTSLSDGNLEAKALSIIDAMTDNPNFPNPVPPLSDLSAALTDYSNALSGAKTKDRTMVAIKNIKREALIAVLRNVAAYVSFTANGNRSVITSSGFDISKEGKTPQTMSAPKNFKITIGKAPGQAFSSVGGVKGVKTYAHQYTADPLTDTSVWQSEYVTTRFHTFNGLTSGKKYWFRVAVLGTGGQIEYTDPVALIIQ